MESVRRERQKSATVFFNLEWWYILNVIWTDLKRSRVDSLEKLSSNPFENRRRGVSMHLRLTSVSVGDKAERVAFRVAI